MSRLRPRCPSAALAISSAALIVALGGTSYAAFRLPNNSVGTKQIKSGAVTAKKLHSGAVSSASIQDGAVTGPKMNFAGVTVPNANNAANAANATSAANAANAMRATNAGHALTADSASNASAVSGNTVTKLFFHGAAGAALVQVYTADGLVIEAGCDNPGNAVAVNAVGTNAPANSHLDIHGDADGSFFDVEVPFYGGSSAHGLNGGNEGSGVLDYSTPDGHVVTMTYGYTSFEADGGCTFSGIAIASP